MSSDDFQDFRPKRSPKNKKRNIKVIDRFEHHKRAAIRNAKKKKYYDSDANV